MNTQNAILGYADSYRTMARIAAKEGKPQEVSMWSVVTDLERNMAPILGASLAREAVLQQRLTAADERADKATSLIRRIVANFDTEIECHEDVEPNDLEHDQVLAEMREFLGALKPAEDDGKPCACPGCDSARRASSPFCVAHRSAKSRTRGQDPLTSEGLEWLMQGDGYQQ